MLLQHGRCGSRMFLCNNLINNAIRPSCSAGRPCPANMRPYRRVPYAPHPCTGHGACAVSYTHLALDIKNRSVTPLFYNSEQVAIIKGGADYSSFVHQRVVARVAPGSLESVLDFYERRLFEELERGGHPECEYRKRSSENGAYRWIAASAQPVPGNEAVSYTHLPRPCDPRVRASFP